MSYDENQARTSKVVVETPTSRREVEHSETYRTPERNGMSGTTVGVIVVLAIALVTIVVLLLMNKQSSDELNANMAANQPTPIPQTTIIQQPAPQQQQPPIIIQQPAQQAPIIVTQPAPATAPAASVNDDSAIQAAIDKRIAADPVLSSLGISVSVISGKATLIGTVKSDSLKSQMESAVRNIRGVTAVDNQIVVM